MSRQAGVKYAPGKLVVCEDHNGLEEDAEGSEKCVRAFF